MTRQNMPAMEGTDERALRKLIEVFQSSAKMPHLVLAATGLPQSAS
jgi:hypothetical protein